MQLAIGCVHLRCMVCICMYSLCISMGLVHDVARNMNQCFQPIGTQELGKVTKAYQIFLTFCLYSTMWNLYDGTIH